MVGDSAWLLKPVSIERAQEMMAIEDIPYRENLVSIALVRWAFFHTKSSEEGHQQYIAAIVNTVCNLIQLKNCHVVFLSTNTTIGGHPTDDRLMAKEVLSLLPNELIKHTSIVEGEYHPEEIQALYSQMTLHLGTRMHSVILAASTTTPVVGIAYEFKMFGLMRKLNLSEYVCDIETISEEDLWDKVSSAFDERQTIRADIVKVLPSIKQESVHNAQAIAGLVQHDFRLHYLTNL